MLYSIIHKLPLWQDVKESTRNVQTFVLATVIYIVLVGTIQSGALDHSQYGNFLKNNIYSIWMIDALYLGVSYYYESKELQDEENDNIIKKKLDEEQKKLEDMKETHEQNLLKNQSLRRKIFTKSDEIYSEIKPDPHKKVQTNKVSNKNKINKANNNAKINKKASEKEPISENVKVEIINDNNEVENSNDEDNNDIPVYNEQSNETDNESQNNNDDQQNTTQKNNTEEDSDAIPIYQS